MAARGTDTYTCAIENPEQHTLDWKTNKPQNTSKNIYNCTYFSILVCWKFNTKIHPNCMGKQVWFGTFYLLTKHKGLYPQRTLPTKDSTHKGLTGKLSEDPALIDILGFSSNGLCWSSRTTLPLCSSWTRRKRQATLNAERLVTGNDVFWDTPRQQNSGKSTARGISINCRWILGVTISVVGVIRSMKGTRKGRISVWHVF